MLGISHDVDDYLKRMQSELDRVCPAEVRRFADLIHDAWKNDRFIFAFGNGGSGATASHFAEDLGKNALREDDLMDETRRRPRVMSLTDNTSWITALGNDVGFEHIFMKQLMQYGRPGDLAIAISVSGNSPNVLSAVDWANRQRLKTFGLTGYDGGKLKRMQQEGLHVPMKDMGMAETIHLGICHWVVEDIHARINRDGRYA